MIEGNIGVVRYDELLIKYFPIYVFVQRCKRLLQNNEGILHRREGQKKERINESYNTTTLLYEYIPNHIYSFSITLVSCTLRYCSTSV